MFRRTSITATLAIVLFQSVAVPAQALPDPGDTRSSAFSALRQRAASSGEVPVILQFHEPDLPFVPGRLTPAKRLRAAQDELLGRLPKSGVRGVKRYQAFPFLALRANGEALARLERDGSVVRVMEDRYLDPRLAESTALVSADIARDAGYTGEGQMIAVLDTGVDADHPFLAGRVVEEACFSTNDPAIRATSLCRDGYAVDFGPGAAAPCTFDADCGHGTAVAGVAAGRDPGGLGFDGVAPDAEIAAIQVATRVNDYAFCQPDAAPCLKVATSDTLLAMDYVYKMVVQGGYPVASLNMSLGYGQYYAPCDGAGFGYVYAAEWLKWVGVASVAATGNDGLRDGTSMPACVSNILAVGSVCDNGSSPECPRGPDSIAESSNIAGFTDLVAPGDTIRTAVPGGGYESKRGTSFAAPFVSGAWALMKQRNPMAEVDDVLAELRANARTVDDQRSGGILSDIRSLDLGFLSTPPDLVNPEIVVALEEPRPADVRTGIGNLRGWAVAPEGIRYVEFYLDGEFKYRVPYGGTRRDVGARYPDYPRSDYSGFSAAFNYALLAPGPHAFRVRAVDWTGRHKEVSATMQVTRFHKPFFSDPAAVDLSSSSVSQDGTGVLIENLRVEDQPYDVRLRWRKESQDFDIFGIE